jgi:hypothetical protein
MYHPSVISSLLPIGGVQPSQHWVVHNQQQNWSSGLELISLKSPWTLELECSKPIVSIQWLKYCGRSQVFGRSVRDTVHLISIESTGWSCPQSQIWIKIWMDWRNVTVSLLQLGVICILKIIFRKSYIHTINFYGKKLSNK